MSKGALFHLLRRVPDGGNRVNRRDHPGARFQEQSHRAGVGPHGVFNGIHPGPQRRLDAALGVGVGGRLAAQAVGCFNNGPQFLVRQLLAGPGRGFAQHPAGCGDLDDIGAALHLAAHGGAAGVRPIASRGGGNGVQNFPPEAMHIAMTAGGRNRLARNQDLRPRGLARLDGVAQGKHGVAAGTQVPDRGETGFEGAPRVHRRRQGVVRVALGRRFQLHARPVLLADVNMEVNKARHDELVPQVYDAPLAFPRRGVEQIARMDSADLAGPHHDGLFPLRRLARRRQQGPGMDEQDFRAWQIGIGRPRQR